MKPILLVGKPILERGITYLQDSGCEIEGVKFWGSPWQPWFFDWAFNLERGEQLRRKWALIPDDTDVLITHGPPAGILDLCPDGRRVGCGDLRLRVEQIEPMAHIFGHIHHSAGQVEPLVGRRTRFINAAICDESYLPTNPVQVIGLPT